MFDELMLTALVASAGSVAEGRSLAHCGVPA
jgi:hypothetical protein